VGVFGACDTWRREKRKIYSANLKGTEKVDEIRVDLETMLKYIFKKIGVNVWTVPAENRRAFVSAESSASINAKECLHKVSKSRN